MSLPLLVALFVAAVLLHNAEEAIWLPAWSKHAGRWHPGVGPVEFRFAAVLLSVLLIASAVAGIASGPRSAAAYLLFGYVFAMTANAVVPHAAVTLASRRYMPGTATGLALNLPLGCLVLRSALADGWVSLRAIAVVAPAVTVVLILAIPLLFSLGRLLFSRAPSKQA